MGLQRENALLRLTNAVVFECLLLIVCITCIPCCSSLLLYCGSIVALSTSLLSMLNNCSEYLVAEKIKMMCSSDFRLCTCIHRVPVAWSALSKNVTVFLLLTASDWMRHQLSNKESRTSDENGYSRNWIWKAELVKARFCTCLIGFLPKLFQH